MVVPKVLVGAQNYLKQSPLWISGQPCLTSYILLPGNNSELSAAALIPAWLDILTPEMFCPGETVEMIGRESFLFIKSEEYVMEFL